MTVDRDLDLAITQYRSEPRFRAFLRILLNAAFVNFDETIETLFECLDIDTASGFWLDRIGDIVGLPRPSIPDTMFEDFFGFDSAGVGFNQGPFAPLAATAARSPMGDEFYLRLLKARIVTITSSCSRPEYLMALREIDPVGNVTDNENMSYTLAVTNRALIELAEELGALPVPMGVRRIFAGAPTPTPGRAFSDGFSGGFE